MMSSLLDAMKSGKADDIVRSVIERLTVGDRPRARALEEWTEARRGARRGSV